MKTLEPTYDNAVLVLEEAIKALGMFLEYLQHNQSVIVSGCTREELNTPTPLEDALRIDHAKRIKLAISLIDKLPEFSSAFWDGMTKTITPLRKLQENANGK